MNYDYNINHAENTIACPNCDFEGATLTDSGHTACPECGYFD